MERSKKSHNKINCRKAKGITLIALVITIVILIILATVAVSFVFGEEGLISRAQQAAEMTEVQNILEQMELAKAEVAMENGGKVTAEDFFEKLEENGIIGSVEGDVTDNGDGTFTVITNDGHEIEVTVTEGGEIEVEYVGKSDEPGIRKIEVSKTSNSVTITVETRNAEGGKLSYSYKKNSEGEDAWQDVEANTDSNTCTINNLQQDEIYNIKVVLEVDGESIERIVNVQVGEMPSGTVAISFTNPTWQDDGTASITINNKEEGYTLQYQIVRAEGGMPAEDGWSEIESGTEITGIKYGDTVYGRLWDGTNGSSLANATIDDDIVPQEATIDLSATTTSTIGSITATVTMKDNESGVDATGSKWIYNTTSTNIGTDEASYTNNFTTNPEEITLQATTVGTYYLHVLTKDLAGNKVEKISEAITVEESTVENTLKAGDYVTYPSAQGDIECRVLYDSTSEYGVQLITSACVGSDITLGDEKDNFTNAMNSYNNAISTLNSAAGAYNNSDYSTARCVGSNPTNPSAEAGYYTFTKFSSSYSGKLKDTDTNCETDYNQMESLEINDIYDGYWLASRSVTSGINGSGFRVRYVFAGGRVGYNNLCSVYSNGATGANGNSDGLRPVFTLKSGIKVTGGNGESGTPYTLGL